MVEGPGDVGFFSALFEANGRRRIQIQSLGSESNLSSSISTLLRIPGFERLEWLGVALDADSNARAQFDSVINAFGGVSTLDISRPSSGWSRTKASSGEIASSILIFPDGIRPGDRERYVWERSLAIHPAATCIEASFECLVGCGIDKTEDWKARVNSLLHALRPKSETRPNAERNGQLLFEITANADYSDILDLIPADDEAI